MLLSSSKAADRDLRLLSKSGRVFPKSGNVEYRFCLLSKVVTIGATALTLQTLVFAHMVYVAFALLPARTAIVRSVYLPIALCKIDCLQ